MTARTARRTALALAVLALALLAAACGGDDDGGASAGGETTVTVFAASSLKEAFTTIAASFEAANPGTRVVLQLAGSDELATQIREGARPDVYAAASPRYPGELAQEGLVEEPVPFATNTLVLAVPAGSPIADLAGVATEGVKLVVGAEGVPVGDYTRGVLEKLDATEGAGFGERVLGNVVSAEQNVKGIVAKLVSGDADAGFIYATDVRAADGALVAIPIPPAAEPGARYPIAVVRDAPAAALAKAFVTAVLDDAGQQALADAGFGRAPA